jgi:protocatechuate 3,4-dioxygenase beta subunit
MSLQCLHNCHSGGSNRRQPHWLVAVADVWRSHAGTFHFPGRLPGWSVAVAPPASTGRPKHPGFEVKADGHRTLSSSTRNYLFD